MLKFNAPWECSERENYFCINDNSGDFLFCVKKDEAFAYRKMKLSKSVSTLVKNAPELYEAAKEMIDLKNKLWYQGLDEIEQGVFNSVLAKLEITIEQIEKEAGHVA